MLRQVLRVNGFYLDEWLYTHGAEYVWRHLPLGVFEAIPYWPRGPQRAYMTLLAPFWGTLDTSTAFTIGHVINALLLVSAMIPAALLARRVVSAPAMRVLAVALAVGVPWLVIGANLLTENLAFPLLLWSIIAIVRAAEAPRLMRQAVALGCIGALGLTRINLVAMFVVLLVAVLVAEARARRAERSVPRREWWAAMARREALILVAAAVGVVGAAWLVATGGRSLGAYAGITRGGYFQSLWSARETTGLVTLTYLRSLATGCFVLPLVVGLAAAMAGASGRLGERLRLPAVVTLASAAAVVLAVALWTTFGAQEERYVFYVYAPLAIFAVAGLEHVCRLRVELAAAGALVVWALAKGIPFPGSNSGNFFAAPAGAFWTRVVDYRLTRIGQALLGWLPGDAHAWFPIAVGLLALVAAVSLPLAKRLRLDIALGAGLVACLAFQVLALHYDFTRLLNGTTEAPGGLAVSGHRARDRSNWIDQAASSGVAIVPSMLSPGNPYGGAETLEFWNHSIEAVVALPLPGAPVPAPAGFAVVAATVRDGVLGLDTPGYHLLAVQADDPRAQFVGPVVARSRPSNAALLRVTTPTTAAWTSDGLEPDGSVVKGRAIAMSLVRPHAPRVRSVVLRLHGPDAAPAATSWSISRPGGRPMRGRVKPAQDRMVRLRVPACPREGRCQPVRWHLTTSGPGAALPLPVYGPPPPPRPVTLQVLSARLQER
jgi:hypothetical protein